MQTLRRTPLYDRHVAAGARLVPFAGWEMPVQYEGVIPEHRAVRTDAGVFDVSHMGELEVEGPTALELLQAMLSNDVDEARARATRSTRCSRTSDGGIIDDLIVYRPTSTATCSSSTPRTATPTSRWLVEHELRGSDVRDVSDEYALLAVQGPRALERLGLAPAKAFTLAMGELDGVEVMINRTGYTGEEGVELGCMADDAARALGRDPRARRHAVRARRARHAAARGLLPAARQRHRPAVGRDLGRARLGVRARQRSSPASSGCARSRSAGPERKLVAFVMTEKAIPRQGMAIEGGGEVTSGIALADARRRHRPRLRPVALRRAGNRARDRRARHARAAQKS